MILHIIACLFIVVVLLVIAYQYIFYPRQTMPHGLPIEILTPNPDKYQNDCLHPCIRFIPEGFCGYLWWMVQSPYYGRDSQLENPILYCSKDKEFSLEWKCMGVVRETPSKGFNSDPILFYEDNKLWIFWREYNTPLCDSLDISMATVGYSTNDGIHFSSLRVYLTQNDSTTDTQQCPILIKRNNKYLFYATHYQYKPERKGLGIAIWEGTSLENPDFILKETLKIPVIYTCDKAKQLKINNHYFFVSKPLKHDIWHFDLFEYKNKLYMFSVAEWGDNIMLSVAEDYKHFRTFRTPLVNAHASEKKMGWRPYFYKPTGFIADNILCLYYTSTGKEDCNKNELYFTKRKLKFQQNKRLAIK